jgi:sugar/nucleoside kinase (ribokinase family)
MTRRWDLLAFGDPCADIVVGIDEAPRLGEKVLGRALGTFSGGTTANVACAFARLGRPAAVFGRVGDDAHGALLRESLQGFGVNTDHLGIEARSASASVIAMVARSGERAIVYVPMAARAPQRAALHGALQQTRIAYAMPYELDDFVLFSRAAREHGAQVAIDLEAAVAPDHAAMWQRIARADIVFFNESGFRAGTGEAPTQASMSRLLAAGVRTVVVTQGGAGAMAVDGNGFVHHAAFPAQVLDTTGAGDTFNAAFLVATLDGQDLSGAVRFACAAASCAVAAVGARSGMPDRRTVDAIVSAPQPSTTPTENRPC